MKKLFVLLLVLLLTITICYAAPTVDSPTDTPVISDTVLAALISFAGVAFAALVSWRVSHSTTSKEIKKMKLEWAHQKAVSSGDEIRQMSAAVSSYLSCETGLQHREALKSVAGLRTKESGDLGAAIDDLYDVLLDTRYPTNPDHKKIKACLDRVIEEKRKEKIAP